MPLPKKFLGQNFLRDQRVITKIITACQLQSHDSILEIGPGEGALTQHIAPLVNNVIAIETDRQLAQQLQHQFSDSNVTIIKEDILRYDFSQLKTGTKLIGNLPYNISSPILEKIIQHRQFIKEAYITVQEEFGRRMVAQKGTRDYSPLSLFVQFATNPSILFKIKNTCFFPVPKVQSCFLKLEILPQPRFPCDDESLLFTLIRCAFQQRRKTLLNALNQHYDKQQLAAVINRLKLPLLARPEELTLQNFVELTQTLNLAKIDKSL